MGHQRHAEDRTIALIDDFPDGFQLNPPASAKEVAESERVLECEFPRAYRDFLTSASGGEGRLAVSRT